MLAAAIIKIQRLPNSEISTMRKKMLNQNSEVASSHLGESKILLQDKSDSLQTTIPNKPNFFIKTIQEIN
jgi:hypothetical protein